MARINKNNTNDDLNDKNGINTEIDETVKIINNIVDMIFTELTETFLFKFYLVFVLKDLNKTVSKIYV